jgi:rRNA maturation RNase YbeY
MRIAISDIQHVRRVRHRLLRLLAEHFLRRAKAAAFAGRRGCVTLVLTDDTKMRRVNRGTFGRDETTDVISCSYTPIPGATDPGADVFINVEQAVSLGTGRGGWSPSRELALYLAHGIDHLAGAEDRNAVERRRMRTRELRWLREAGKDRIDGLVAP